MTNFSGFFFSQRANALSNILTAFSLIITQLLPISDVELKPAA